MRHLIFTRYNLPLTFGKTAGAEQKKPDAAWLENRKALFDRYCLPSMRNQTLKDFDWYIAFGPNTPKDFTDYFEDIGTPIFATSMDDVRAQVQKRYPDQSEQTIISRLDNDDALAAKYVETTQNYAGAIFKSSGSVGIPHAINFVRGWEIEHATGKLFARDYRNSSFFSLLTGPQKPAQMFDVLGGHHAHVQKNFPTTNVLLKHPMWLINVHGENVANQIKGNPIAEGEMDAKDYFGDAPWCV